MPEGIEVADIPTPESLYSLSLDVDRYLEDTSRALTRELDQSIHSDFCETDLPKLTASCTKLIAAKHKEFINGDCKPVLEWLEAEPAFAMAKKYLKFVKVEDSHWEASILRELERWLPSLRLGRHSSFLAHKLIRLTSSYIKYVSRVAEAAYRYTSRLGYVAAVEGPSTIRCLQALVTELGKVMKTSWLPEDLKQSLKHSLRTKSALDDLNMWAEKMSSGSLRNDIDLPTRLFATDLLRIHQESFNSHHKKAVFLLMGFSFVDRPLEMRTIERLAKSEMDAHRLAMAKRIADKRGLDFEHVLTTLKANKSFTLPREKSD
jgi:hypothetical protein